MIKKMSKLEYENHLRDNGLVEEEIKSVIERMDKEKVWRQ